MAAKKDGTIVGIRAKVWANMGAYLSTASTGSARRSSTA